MKRLGSADSLGAMISICPSADEKVSAGNNNNNSNNVYGNRGFRSNLEGLDEEDCVEESGQITEKKRRLSVDQVKALEKNFEVENKLEPERKVKLAQELGLQPRQVAVWFQNRRARWKTKQLERDYGLLKANYEALKLDYDKLNRDKEALLAEMRELKAKVKEENVESNSLIKEEAVPLESENKVSEQSKISVEPESNLLIFGGDLKDGSSDSDSSAILNDDNSPYRAPISPPGALPQTAMIPPVMFSSSSASSPSSVNCLPFPEQRISSSNAQKGSGFHQCWKIEEHNFFDAEEPCNFYADEQAPSLPWYYQEPWN